MKSGISFDTHQPHEVAFIILCYRNKLKVSEFNSLIHVHNENGPLISLKMGQNII